MDLWLPYDVGWFNGGQRTPPSSLLEAWVGLLNGRWHEGRKLVALHVGEVGDQGRALLELEHYGYKVLRGPSQDDKAKEAIIIDPERVRLFRPFIQMKVGDAFEGRRSGHHGPVRMANKWVSQAELEDLASGHTPTHQVAHVWPSVSLNSSHVADAVRRMAHLADATHGTLIHTCDWNMARDSHLMAPFRALRLESAQETYGPQGTFYPGGRPIDDIHVRTSRHFRTTELLTLDMPGHERGGGEHRALVQVAEIRKKTNV
jgi:hypothetical protein